MKNTDFKKTTVIISFLLLMMVTVPALARTKDDVKALQAEVEALRASQQQMQKDLAEVKKMLEQGAKAPAAAPAPASFKPADLEVGSSPVIGSADATVTIFAYSDYQCPFCGRHATTVLPRMVNEYVDSGQLRFVMREYPIEAIHPRAFAASQSALCAGAQGKYWEMHDLIFANQRTLSDDDFTSHSQTLELDAAAFQACLSDEEINTRIRAEVAEAYELGISGTPSFVAGLTDQQDSDKVHVTEYIRGAQPFERFQGVVEKLLEEAAKPQ